MNLNELESIAEEISKSLNTMKGHTAYMKMAELIADEKTKAVTNIRQAFKIIESTKTDSVAFNNFLSLAINVLGFSYKFDRKSYDAVKNKLTEMMHLIETTNASTLTVGLPNDKILDKYGKLIDTHHEQFTGVNDFDGFIDTHSYVETLDMVWAIMEWNQNRIEETKSELKAYIDEKSDETGIDSGVMKFAARVRSKVDDMGADEIDAFVASMADDSELKSQVLDFIAEKAK